MRLKLSLVAALTLLSAGVAGRFDSAQTPPPSAPPKYAFGEPGISPDGREIAFTSGGDIWTVPASGGDARLLVADPAYDRRPLFSPDGRELAFISSRTGGGDIYVLTLATGTLRRLTWDDGLEQLDGWSRDSRWIYFSSTSRDIAGMNDIFRVPREGGTPMPVTDDRYVNEFGAAASPDGQRLAFVARGIGSNQWWRKAGSHLDESELWVVDFDKIATDGAKAYTEITKRDARQLWPMWNADGSSLFYVADRDGAENIWTRPASATGADRAVTSFHDGRVLWPSITTDGKTIAFERDFGIWTVDTAGGQAREVPIARRGVAVVARARAHATDESVFGSRAVARRQEGRVRRARRRVRGVGEGRRRRGARDATPDLESQPVWAPDSRRLAYVAARGARPAASSATISCRPPRRALTSGTATDLSPVFSPDGKSIAFLRDRKELRVLDLASKQDRVVATGTFADTVDTPRPVWSPDGKWIAVFAIGAKALHERRAGVGARRRPAASGQLPRERLREHDRVEPRRVVSARSTRASAPKHGQLARVDLTLRTPKFREDLFRDLFTEPTRPPEPARNPPGTPGEPRDPEPAREPATEPLDPVFADIRQRLSLLPLGLDVERRRRSVPTARRRSSLPARRADPISTRGRSTSSRPIVRSRGS